MCIVGYGTGALWDLGDRSEIICILYGLNSIFNTNARELRPCFNSLQGAVSIRKTVLSGMAIPMLKIRRSNGRLIFNMEIAIRR